MSEVAASGAFAHRSQGRGGHHRVRSGSVTIVAAASEFVPPPANGRTFVSERTVRLGDVDDRARLRLDAIARYLQDVATDDTASTDLDDDEDGRGSSWVVRRTLVEVHRAARLDERLELATFCSGIGRGWAERRTSIVGTHGASIETVSLWIRIDPASGRPIRLSERFLEIYGPTAGGRRISSRLQLPPPSEHAERRTWAIRRVDLDPLRHVNNAVHWSIVEETLPQGSRRGRGEIEYLAPIEPDADLTLATDGASSWLVAGDRVLTAATWTPTS